MELERITSLERDEHISSVTDDLVSLASTNDFEAIESDPERELEEHIPPTEPEEVALLWSSVFEKVVFGVDILSSTEPSVSDHQGAGKSYHPGYLI
jgi:hypothetical protein